MWLYLSEAKLQQTENCDKGLHLSADQPTVYNISPSSSCCAKASVRGADAGTTHQRRGELSWVLAIIDMLTGRIPTANDDRIPSLLRTLAINRHYFRKFGSKFCCLHIVTFLGTILGPTLCAGIIIIIVACGAATSLYRCMNLTKGQQCIQCVMNKNMFQKSFKAEALFFCRQFSLIGWLVLYCIQQYRLKEACEVT